MPCITTSAIFSTTPNWRKAKYAPAYVPLAAWDELETIVTPLEPLLVPRGLYLDVVVAPDADHVGVRRQGLPGHLDQSARQRR